MLTMINPSFMRTFETTPRTDRPSWRMSYCPILWEGLRALWLRNEVALVEGEMTLVRYCAHYLAKRLCMNTLQYFFDP
jgi:hypothetical protein